MNVGSQFRVCEGRDLKLHEQPACGLQSRADRLDFRVLLQHFMTHFAPPTRLFIPTKGKSSVENVVAVNPNRTGTELGSQAMRLLNIPSPNARSQPINRIVSLREHLCRVAERNRRDHWSEDLLLHDLHLFIGIHQDRRLDEVAFVAVAASSDHGLGAFGESRLEIATYTIQLFGGNQRTYVG